MISKEMHINRETVQLIMMEDFGTNKVCAKTVQKNLTTTNCSRRWNCVLIFCNESRRLAKGRTECNGNLQADASPRKRGRQSQTVHQEHVPPGSTVSQKFYLQVMEPLGQRISYVKAALFLHGWILHRDNSSSQRFP
jgi:hypothetical protein